MVKINILKNGIIFKSYVCPEKLAKKYFAIGVDIAGGMWNGKDDFKVEIENLAKQSKVSKKRNIK